jgi:hypothetical protein
MGDVAISHCSVDQGGIALAQIEVTNHSSSPADYVVTVTFTSAGTKSESGPGFVRGVAPGATAPDQVSGTKSLPVHAGVTCKVATVRRTPSTITSTT